MNSIFKFINIYYKMIRYIILIVILIIIALGYFINGTLYDEYVKLGTESFDNTITKPDYDIIEIPNFLSDFECDQIIELAKNKTLFPSRVYDTSNDNYDTNTRKSNQCWLKDIDNQLVKIISKRSAYLTNTVGNYQEDLQVVSYNQGGFFSPHYDACNGTEEYCKRLNNEGYRLATVLIYLNDDFTGGETVFPKINKTVKPIKGKAVLFYNVDNNGKPINESMHGGNPVTSGTKYICNKWIRTKKISEIKNIE